MNQFSDSELLNDYARRGTETAFAELVRRHVGLVYSTALRAVVDPHLAEDVAQAAFIALAQNARKLRHRQVLSGWLHVTARNLAANTVRRETRRRVREQEAAFMPSPESETLWEPLAPDLDGALAELKEADRDALMLRFFERKSAREIGERFGLAEKAVQKRIERALERLRTLMASRGITVSAVVLAGVLSQPMLQAAPVGLADTLAANVFSKVAASTAFGGVAKGVNLMAQLKTHPVLATIALLACLSLTTTGFVTGRKTATKHHAAAAWREAMLSTEAQAVDELTSPMNADPGPSPSPAPARSSVAEILAEAAAHFRSQGSDPDATYKGMVALQKLRPDEALDAVQALEAYKNEPAVFNGMGPALMALWAETDAPAAIQYELTHFNNDSLGLAIQWTSQVWARHEPSAAWTWYRDLTDTGKSPIGQSSWQCVPIAIFSEWAMRDTPGAFDQLARVELAEERAAIHGISQVVKMPEYRPALLSAVSQMPDDQRRRLLAAEIADDWAEVDPQGAIEWAGGLQFENPSARIHVLAEAWEQWSQLDPHSAAVWALSKAPLEFLNLFRAEQLKNLHDAAQH